MDENEANSLLLHDRNITKVRRADKFRFVSCSVKGVYCSKILPEINELYANSELARIDKEYQRSAELLQQAYVKTIVLEKPVCAQCVNFFQTSITETVENMQKEVLDMSLGFYHRKYYEQTYARLCGFLKKLKMFNFKDVGNLITVSKSSMNTDS